VITASHNPWWFNGIKFKTEKVNEGTYFTFFSVILIVVLYLIGNSLSRLDGAILILLFLVNGYNMVKKRKNYKVGFNKEQISRQKIILYSFIFIFSLIVLFISSMQIVKYSHLIATDMGVPEILIGIFLVSIATTLPELIFGINAVLMKHSEMAIGDQSGTVFVNITLVLGIVALISPITSAFLPFIISGVFMVLSMVVFLAFIHSGRRIDLVEGISLVILYISFVLIQLFAS